MIGDDHQLRVLFALLRRVEGDEVLRVQDAIRQRRRVLEDEQQEAEFPNAFRRATDRPPVTTEPDRRF